MAFQAYRMSDSEPINVGDTVIDFRGQECVIKSIDRANEPGRDGKVTVTDSPVSYYAAVFGLYVKKV